MTRVFAVFFRLPFEKRTLTIYQINNTIKITHDFRLLVDYELICINFDDYLQSLHNSKHLPIRIFDVNVANRILTGLSKSDLSNSELPWSGISCLGKHINGASKEFHLYAAIERGRFGSYREWIETLPPGWQNDLIKALKSEYNNTSNKLSEINSFERFVNTEMPLYLTFAKIGVDGINVNKDKLEKLYYKLDYEYYKAVKTLEIDFNFMLKNYTSNITYNDIKEYVPGLSPDDFSNRYFWESVELLQDDYPFLNALLVEYRNHNDINEILRIWSSLSNRCRISYDIFGTVSGRIMITRPGIQHLKKTSRDIFESKDGYKFIYADYAQFEPGILASISGDDVLLDVYNTGDVYQGLADKIGSGCTRKVAKQLFLSYIYGMSRTTLNRRIEKNFGEASGTFADEFFHKFKQVEKWRRDVIQQTKDQNMAKGKFSYIRMINGNENSISRWAPNHIIQSTASGIFKDALLDISKQLNHCRILVPMHDAILVECPEKDISETENEIKLIMAEAFHRVCENVNIQIVFGNF